MKISGFQMHLNLVHAVQSGLEEYFLLSKLFLFLPFLLHSIKTWQQLWGRETHISVYG